MTSKGLETVEPKGLSEEKAAMLERLSAACDCLCSGNQYAGAKGAGKNSSTCGCYCALNNDNANSNGANVAAQFTEDKWYHFIPKGLS